MLGLSEKPGVTIISIDYSSRKAVCNFEYIVPLFVLDFPFNFFSFEGTVGGSELF
jgi:hypothetical protein